MGKATGNSSQESRLQPCPGAKASGISHGFSRASEVSKTHRNSQVKQSALVTSSVTMTETPLTEAALGSGAYLGSSFQSSQPFLMVGKNTGWEPCGL